MVYSGPGTERITNDLCSPYSVHYTYDTWSLANTTARATVEQGGKSWYFLTADYGFGYTLQASATEVVKANGGTVLGAARHPLARRTSPLICCRPRPAARRSSGWPTRAATRSTRSRRPANSG